MQKIKKIIFVINIALLICATAMADDKKVAVLEPTGVLGANMRGIVRDEISYIIANTDGYVLIDRQLTDQNINESGAEFLFATNIESADGNFNISCTFIDAHTGHIESQRTAQSSNDPQSLIVAVRAKTGEIMASMRQSPVQTLPEPVQAQPEPVQTQPEPVQTQTAQTPQPVANVLIADKRTVYANGRELSQHEVREMMTVTREAFLLYNRGIKRNRNGNIWMFAGVAAITSGVAIMATKPFEEKDYYYRSDGNYNLRQYYRYQTNRAMVYGIGGVLVGTGAVAFLTGAIQKGTSKNLIRRAVDMHNRDSRYRNASNMELKFNFTGNDMRLTLNF